MFICVFFKGCVLSENDRVLRFCYVSLGFCLFLEERPCKILGDNFSEAYYK